MGRSLFKEDQVFDLDFVNPDDFYYHEDYDQYVEIGRSGGKVVLINVWQDSSKTKIRSTASLSYSQGKVSQIVKTLYLEDGITVSGTVTTNITRQGSHVTSVEVVRS